MHDAGLLSCSLQVKEENIKTILH